MKIRKILCLILVLSIIILSLASCSKNEQPPKGMKKMSSEFIGYKLYIPEEWTENISTGFISAYAKDLSNISIQTMSLSGVFESGTGYVFYADNVSYSSIDDYFRNNYLTKINGTFSSFNLKEEYTTNQKFGESDKCAKYVYTLNVDGIEYTFLQIFTIYGSNLYIFTYTATSDNFESHISDINNIINNFSFKG